MWTSGGLHWDGTRWSRTSNGRSLQSIALCDGARRWYNEVIGNDSCTLTRPGWSANFRTVWGAGAGAVWRAGGYNTIAMLEHDGWEVSTGLGAQSDANGQPWDYGTINPLYPYQVTGGEHSVTVAETISCGRLGHVARPRVGGRQPPLQCSGGGLLHRRVRPLAAGRPSLEAGGAFGPASRLSLRRHL